MMRNRIAAILVADVVGYARLLSTNEKAGISAIRGLKEECVEPIAGKHEGEILKRLGDGWIIAFNSVHASVQCAMKIQETIAKHPSLKMRIGAHIGEIVEDDTDFYGAGVNLAQRLQAEAPPGGVMVSQDLYRQMTGPLSEAFEDAGSFKLKNIALPVTGYQWRPRSGERRTTGEVPTIALEPIEFAPDDSETRAIASDVHDQILMALSRRTGIRVLDDAAGIANESEYVLRGRLRVSGGRGRLNLAMVLREENRVTFSKNYEHPTTDMLQFCDFVVERADADLRLQINAFDGSRLAGIPDDKLSVSELRSKAANAFYAGTIESYEYAKQLMDRAIELNPSDAMALAMRADAVIILAAAHFADLDAETVNGIENDLDMAVEISPRSDFIFVVKAFLQVFGKRDHVAGRRDSDYALSLNPGYALGFWALAQSHLLAGEFGDAIAAFEKSIALAETDPLLPTRLFPLSMACYLDNQFEQAAAAMERAIQLKPKQWAFHHLRALCCRQLGDTVGAEKSEAVASRLPKGPSVFAIKNPLPDECTDFIMRFAPAAGR